jgi:hypothetical protein
LLFYFNRENLCYEKIYHFHKKGKIKLDSSEHTLLSEEMIVNAIRIPNVPAWYYNKDDMYIGTDTLVDN